MIPEITVLFGFCVFNTVPACSFSTDCTFLSLQEARCCFAGKSTRGPKLQGRFQVEGSSWPCLQPLFVHAVVYMGPRASMLYSYEDPWGVSAFSFVFTRLLFTVLVLAHTILVCFTFQLMKWYGWWMPSRRDCAYGQGGSIRCSMCAAEKPFDGDSKASKGSPWLNAEKSLKRPRGESWQSAESKLPVYPKALGVSTLTQGFPLKNATLMSPQWGETSRCLNGANSKNSHVEGGFRVRNANEESLNDTNMPMDTRKLSPIFMNEDGMCTDGVIAEVGSSFKVLVADGQDKVSQKRVSMEMTNCKLESSELAWCRGKEMLEEFVEEELFAVVKRKFHENNDYSSDNTVKGSKNEDYFDIPAKKGDNNGYESEGIIKGLLQAIQDEREKLRALYVELEVERIASETAANEAMSMISRLQEEKAALHMQAAHFQRMAEEKAKHDEQAMQLLKEILCRKERENYVLVKEVKFMRTAFYKDARRYGKERPDVERRSCFAKSGEAFLLKNIEVSNLEEGHGVQRHGNVGAVTSAEKPPCPRRIIDEQPLKRLKSVSEHGNGSVRSTFLVADGVHCASAVGYQKVCLSQQSVFATPGSDGEVYFEFGHRKQVCKRMANVFENGENSAELSVPLELAQ